MKKITMIFLLILFLSGCATYNFQHGQKPYDQGYVVSRDNYPILEYTVGKDNSVPADIDLAKERFNRRRKEVEQYYKKIGVIENRFKKIFWDYPGMLVEFIAGQFRLPFIAMSERRYERDPKYREKIDRIEQEKEAQEQARINKIKSDLGNYIQKDLTAEQPAVSLASIKKIEPQQTQPAQIVAPEEVAPAEKPAEKEEEKESELEGVKTEQKISEVSKQSPQEIYLQKKEPDQLLGEQTKAVIIAKPTKGFSPLVVHFYGSRSYSPHAKIVSYSWDFGDGDTSTKANPANTYYSSSFEPMYFTATLTVQDNKGNIDTASIIIEVLNK